MNIDTPEYTPNAQMLLGYVLGCLKDDLCDNEQSMYRTVSYDAENGTAILETKATGNRFALSVRQISGNG